jgi:SsrA-binding protein
MTAVFDHHAQDVTRIATNRKALRDYVVLERFEAGIELRGTEVKSIRQSRCSLSAAFARVEDGQVFLYDFNVLPYEYGNQFNHDAARPKRLLLHRRQIDKLIGHTAEKGCALIPLSLYIRRGLVKLEMGLCKGRRFSDKREALRRKEADRETRRAMRNR